MTALHVLRWTARALAWTLVGMLGSLAVAIALPNVVGYRSLTVMSGSMEPVIHTGDVVVTRPMAAAEARPGDVITFRHSAGRLVTHRVRSVKASGDNVEVETKGDANNTGERWSVASTGTVGRVVYRVDKVGYVLRLAHSPRGRLLLVVVPALALGAMALVKIWSTPGPPSTPAPVSVRRV